MALGNGVDSKPIMKTFTFNDSHEMDQRYEFLRTGKNSDITFDIGNDERKVFDAHRLYLSAGSETFAKMLDSKLDSTSIRILEIHPTFFEELLKYEKNR